MPTLAQRIKTATDLPARKPLYLLGHEPARIDAGADHLMLRRATGNPIRFPLARVCRIICTIQITWTGSALSLCLREGVPITWVDGHGHALGFTQTRYAQPLPFSTLIETYLELPDWSRRFENWRARRRLETLTACAKRAAEKGFGLDALGFQELKREYVYNGEHPIAFNPEGEGWCHALAIDRLHREGLHGCYWGHGATRLALADELAALLWAELNLECGTIPAGAGQGIVIAHLFESWAHQREGRLLQHLGDLKRHLSREIETWH